MPPLQSDTATTILDAALTELVEHGMRRTSVSDIARRAGLSRQTVYRYWPDARSIFAALITREFVAVFPDIQTLASINDLDTFAGAIVDAADAIRLMPLFDRLRDTDPELLAHYVFDRLGRSQRTMMAVIMAGITGGQESGFVRPGPAEHLAAYVLLIAQAAVLSGPLFEDILDEHAWRTELRQALCGYLAVRA